MDLHDLRCWAWRRGDGPWIAQCIDLDITVEGASLPEAKRSLTDAIDLYLEHVGSLPMDQRSGLVPRPVPWPSRLLYVALATAMRLLHRQHGERRSIFTIHSPA